MFRSAVFFSVLLVALLSLTIGTNHIALATSNTTQVTNQTKGLFNGTTIEPREISFKANQTTSMQNQTAQALPSTTPPPPPPPTERSFLVQEITPQVNQTTPTGNQTAEALPPPPTGRYFLPIISTIARGYFGLGDWESVVHVTSNADFLTCIWARNVEISQGGVQILTPPSDFRGRGSTGPFDGLVLDVPAQTGMDLGCIGADAGETIDISNAFGARVTVYLTVITAQGATVNMIGVPMP
jgi:hypothetical protein